MHVLAISLTVRLTHALVSWVECPRPYNKLRPINESAMRRIGGEGPRSGRAGFMCAGEERDQHISRPGWVECGHTPPPTACRGKPPSIFETSSPKILEAGRVGRCWDLGHGGGREAT